MTRLEVARFGGFNVSPNASRCVWTVVSDFVLKSHTCSAWFKLAAEVELSIHTCDTTHERYKSKNFTWNMTSISFPQTWNRKYTRGKRRRSRTIIIMWQWNIGNYLRTKVLQAKHSSTDTHSISLAKTDVSRTETRQTLCCALHKLRFSVTE